MMGINRFESLPTGEWRHQQKAIKIKKHGRKAISFFRYGLDLIRETILNVTRPVESYFEQIVGFLDINIPNRRVV